MPGHMVHRSWEGGKSALVNSVEDLVKGTGSAVMLASIPGCGFACCDCRYGGMQSLGLVMVLGISCRRLPAY